MNANQIGQHLRNVAETDPTNRALYLSLAGRLKDVDTSTREVVEFGANLNLKLIGPDGRVKDERDVRNIICTIGKQQILKYTTAKYLNQFAYCVIGTGSGAGAITESGMLDAATTGNLLARQVFSVINKGASDTLQVTWQFT